MVCSIAGSHVSVRNWATVWRFGATYWRCSSAPRMRVSSACAAFLVRKPRRRVCFRSPAAPMSTMKYQVPFSACLTLPRRPSLIVVLTGDVAQEIPLIVRSLLAERGADLLTDGPHRSAVLRQLLQLNEDSLGLLV